MGDRHSGRHGIYMPGGFKSDESKNKTCQHSSGCTKPVERSSYCQEHYEACYIVGSAPLSGRKGQKIGQVGWGGFR